MTEARETPTSQQRTIWRASGRWFHRRDAAYYAIAKALVVARYPRWLEDSDVEVAVDVGIEGVRTEGDLHANADGIPLAAWRLRRDRRIALFHTVVSGSYDEAGGDYFDPDRWQAFVRRVARFIAFVDRRRCETDALATKATP